MQPAQCNPLPYLEKEVVLDSSGDGRSEHMMSSHLSLLEIMANSCKITKESDIFDPTELSFLGHFAGREREKLAKKCAQFDKRACDHAVRERFYAALNQLIGGDASPIGEKERLLLAEQVVGHAASPDTVHQGHHNTCSAATAERLLYLYEPASAAQFIADIAVNGSYTWDLYKTAVPNSIFEKDAEARSSTDRDYASQIFQLGLINVYWGGQNHGPFGIKHKSGAITFEETEKHLGAGDTGERLMLNDGVTTRVVANNPEVPAEAVQYMYAFAVKDFPPDFVVENIKGRGGPSLSVASAADLKKIVVDRTTTHRPLVVKIHAGNEPFLNGLQGINVQNLDSFWHVISVEQFDPSTGMVKIHNTASRDEADQWIGLSTLYDATMAPGSERWKYLLRQRHPW